MAGTAVYTVSNSSNEFVLVSDPNNGMKSLGLLCFCQEDAQALLVQVQLRQRQPVLGKGARVVPITLDQVIDTVEEIQERHNAVKEIEKRLLELHQVFMDMAVLVEAQGDILDNIEIQGWDDPYVPRTHEGLLK